MSKSSNVAAETRTDFTRAAENGSYFCVISSNERSSSSSSSGGGGVCRGLSGATIDDCLCLVV